MERADARASWNSKLYEDFCSTCASILSEVYPGAKVIKQIGEKREMYQDLSPCRCHGRGWETQTKYEV